MTFFSRFCIFYELYKVLYEFQICDKKVLETRFFFSCTRSLTLELQFVLTRLSVLFPYCSGLKMKSIEFFDSVKGHSVSAFKRLESHLIVPILELMHKCFS